MTGFALRAAAVVVGLITATAFGPSPAARQAPQDQRPVFRAGANIVRVDVTVTNHSGEPATDLTRDDFSLTEDGAPQTIDSFELVRATGEPADDRALEIRSPSQVAAEAARDDVRLFLIFWDEYHIGQFIPAQRAREALTEFVRSGFGPTDLVGIMDQLTTVDSIKFTRDRLQLADEVHALKGRLGVLVPPRSAVEQAHMQYPRDIGRLRNEVTTSALNAAAAFLGNFRDGRKALLFVSQGIALYGRSGESNRYAEIVRTANTNNTAIYTLDPSSEVGRRPDSLISLAAETGGRPFVGSNRPEQLLPQMVRDASAYYLLGYRSPAPVDGKFHRIKVRLHKDGYDVRARSGYFAPSVGDMERGRAEAAAAELPSDVERALGELSLTERADRQVDYWIGMSRGEAGRTRVTIVWSPRTSTTPNAVALAVDAASPDGTRYFEASRTTTREVSFEAPSGDLVLTTTALNARGEDVDGDVRRLTIPSFEGPRLAIGSPIVLRSRTARGAREISEGGAAIPEVGRAFDRTDRLFIRFPVYGGGPDIAGSARLLNGRGKDMRTLEVTRLDGDRYQLDLPLSVSARGDYVIAFEASRGKESIRALVPIRVR